MYRAPGNRYRGSTYATPDMSRRGSLPAGDASEASQGPAASVLESGASQEGRGSISGGHRTRKSNECAVIDGVDDIINSPDSETFSAKAQENGQAGEGGYPGGLGVYFIASKARIPKGDRRALYGLSNGGD